MKEAVVVSAVRTAIGKAPRGALRHTRPEYMAAEVIEEAIRRAPGLLPETVEDVVLGCAFPEAEAGLNIARIAALKAGLPVSVPGLTVNRFCASGLETIAIAAQRIMTGSAAVIIAGGVETMSLIPIGGNKPVPEPDLLSGYPEAYITMGLTAENVARKFNVTRSEQDQFALLSQERTARAISEGRFRDQILPLRIAESYLENVPHLSSLSPRASSSLSSPYGRVHGVIEGEGRSEGNPHGKVRRREFVFDTDECPRPTTTLEGLAVLKPVFHARGTVTAGNSCPMSDGAAAVVVMSREKAKELGLRPMAVFRSYAAAGVAPDLMGIGPVEAVPKALRIAGLTLSDIDLIELNEAFASQVLHVTRFLGMDMARVNVNGGAIALGHPLGCTGSFLTAKLLYEMTARKSRFGLVTMCVGGGMGAAGVFERED